MFLLPTQANDNEEAFHILENNTTGATVQRYMVDAILLHVRRQNKKSHLLLLLLAIRAHSCLPLGRLADAFRPRHKRPSLCYSIPLPA